MRLLNDKEIEVAIKCDLEMLGFTSIENIKEATKAQDAKTLKAVGKWLWNHKIALSKFEWDAFIRVDFDAIDGAYEVKDED